MKGLIISADDFGLTEGVTKGISQSIINGLVTRTSAMMCTNGLAWIKKYSNGLNGKIGLHLQLTDGTPLLPQEEVLSLVNVEGNFPEKSKQLGNLNLEEISKEWEAQMAALLNLGITPSHIDTHHNVHRFPKIFKVYCAIAEKYKLPARALSPNMAKKLDSMGLLGSNFCLEEWCGENVTSTSLVNHTLSAFRSIGNEGVVELMCHPGYVDQNLKARSHYLLAREQELEVFLEPKLKMLLEKHNIELI
ncbi:MAG: putative glycoside hydrolase/deacetylase ChbG (UPF0249 family) [Glaciecola sp.]|jgi:predicted glycoside hydrolase/deacetylase ChbG (UPF0249 family)